MSKIQVLHRPRQAGRADNLRAQAPKRTCPIAIGTGSVRTVDHLRPCNDSTWLSLDGSGVLPLLAPGASQFASSELLGATEPTESPFHLNGGIYWCAGCQRAGRDTGRLHTFGMLSAKADARIRTGGKTRPFGQALFARLFRVQDVSSSQHYEADYKLNRVACQDERVVDPVATRLSESAPQAHDRWSPDESPIHRPSWAPG